MDIEQFYELAKQRRSIRGYRKDKDVPEEWIRKILEVARWAPSGGNGQPWEFIVIRDAAMRRKIADLFLKQQEHKKEMEMALRGEAKMTGAGFKDAPVFILVVGDPRVNESYPIRTREEKGFQHLITGLANAVLLIHLSATSLGLASQYVSDASSPYMGTMLKSFLGIPDRLKVYELIPVGFPRKEISPPPRRPLEEMVHYEKYDPAKARSDEDLKRFLFSMSRLGSYGKGADKAVEDLHFRRD